MKQRFSTALRQPLIALPTSDGVFLMIVGAFAAIVCNEIHGAPRAVIKAWHELRVRSVQLHVAVNFNELAELAPKPYSAGYTAGYTPSGLPEITHPRASLRG